MPAATSYLLIVAGFVPSLVWLFVYLKKDCHPEPKNRIAQVFFVSMVMAPLAIIGQKLFVDAIRHFHAGYSYSHSLSFFLWAAFIEEVVKYLVVFFIILRTPDFDEPIDALIYMITAALGFAALENILVLFRNISDGITITTQIWILRFFGATLLHALSSALVGYFLALSWFYRHHSRKIVLVGLLIATFFHFVFNVTFVLFDPSLQARGSFNIALLSSSIVIAFLVAAVSFLFYQIKKRELSTNSVITN